MKIPVPPFSCHSVHLRMLGEEDVECVRLWRNRDEVRRWFRFSGIVEPEQQRLWYERYRDRDDDYMFIVETGEPPQRAGVGAIYGIDRNRAEAEIGRFAVAPEFAGRGVMRRGIAALTVLAHRRMGLRSLHLEVLPDNAPALHIYRSLGFCDDGPAQGMIRLRIDEPALKALAEAAAPSASP